MALENGAKKTESAVGPWIDPIIDILKHFVELLPPDQSQKMLSFLNGTFQEFSDDQKERYKQDIVKLSTAGASEEEVAKMILKMTAGGYDPDLSGGGSCDTTIPNEPSVDEDDNEDDYKDDGATFATPNPVNVTNTCDNCL